ncbi:PucR family transcriptional regulator [Aeromicrobium wangtongii]|uniref:PucR family transcriptional regulator ligand-binding domain-containing protein n=1 Tax=Aeromicrobium wangtongii TaxID=2969247 RepID=A0ABY5M3F0_9ACTN|nr:PucR family transcriptional regulator ligand-binding domain-containing protein [Aeromicrobium wangtongii]MCD9199253.1 PucR family transcriptional regulator ligand-binding domain-containing protein [Aeromicrobium wangtongii]UUP12720.1 PucR family transcriptional regulator ligand-binding domain-containing protein [Aeromicrobium wangtongii]
MVPTVRSILATAEMRAGRPEVLTGGSQLDRAVRWVHVSEVEEVAGLLEGEELILSTGLAMSGSADAAVAYVSALIDAGAAGLVIELGERFRSVPQPVLDVARDAEFPVVVLHRQTRFVLVTEQVHREIVADRFDFVRFAQQVHETFTALSLDGGGPDDIVRAGAAIAGASMVLEDLNRRVVAFHAIGRPAAGLLADWERRSRLCPLVEHTALTGVEGWLTTPVGNRGNAWGRLVIPNPVADQQRSGMLIERTAQALQLSRMVERDQLSLQLQAQGGFLTELLEERIVDETTASTRARALGLTAGSRYVAVVVQSDAPADATSALRARRRLTERVARTLGAARLSAVSGLLGDDQVGLLMSIPAGTTDDAVLTALAQALHAEDGGRLTVGVGTTDAGLLRTARSLRIGQHVARVAHEMGPSDRPFHRQADIRLHGLVAQLRDDPRVQAFVEAELDPLLEHEARHGDGLLDLLRMYLAVGGNKAELARTAHRNRPSLYAKLARIEQVLGVPIDDPASRLSLGVALMAHDQAR